MKTLDVAKEAYLAAAAAHAGPAGTVPIALCQDAARTAILEYAKAGGIDVQVILAEYAHAQAQAAHRSLTEAGKSLVRRVAAGELPFASLLDGAVCSVGDGQVALFGRLSALTLPLADKERYENLVDAQEAYQEWRDGIYDHALPILIRHNCSIEEAVANGWLQ